MACGNIMLQTVASIEELLSQAVALQKEYVERVCTECETPCCLRVRYLYNDKDVLFLKLSGRKRNWRREGFTKKGCRSLGEQGCTLAHESRPFICHTYLCEDLKTEMKQCDPEILPALKRMFKEIEALRSQLWVEN